MRRTTFALIFLSAGLPALAQYAGKVSTDAKNTPDLRSIAVLEWTGEQGNPTASRLVPVSVLDAGTLQDGAIYLARPEPLALVPEVEYQLEENGKPIGLFDIKNAGQVEGAWVGFGAWKPMPTAKPKLSAKDLAKMHVDEDDSASDTPVLHRKHAASEPAKGKGTGANPAGGDSSASTEPSDPDRPVLHKKDSGSDDKAANSSSTADQSSSDPDRPTLKKPRKPKPAETASDENTDPDRPRLKRGKSSGDDIEVTPSLKGFPPDVKQTVAISDAKTRPAHPFAYSWANPDDEARMKSALEAVARTALGLDPAAKPAPRRTTATAATTTRRATKPKPPAELAPLAGEQFRVFELAYGSSATLVLSAHTDAPAGQQKFVTIVAQPDLYGNPLILLKSVTDQAHLDDTPRMRLVDAVDAMADNRGELLFELRGSTQRQFALYRVLRGQAEKLFVTGNAEFTTASTNQAP